MKNKNILKILAGLIVFSLTIPVFSKVKDKKVKRLFETFLSKSDLKEENKDLKYCLLTFVEREMHDSEEFKKFLKDNKIFTSSDIIENFEGILKKIVVVKEKKIKSDEEKLSKWEEIVKSKEFKKQYTKYQKNSAKSWKVCGVSSPKYEKLEKSKAQKLVKKDVEEMLKNAENYDGEAFLEYKKWKKEELEDFIKYNKATVEDINKILSTKDRLKTAVDIYKEIVKSCRKEQKTMYESFEKNLKKEILNKKVKQQ